MGLIANLSVGISATTGAFSKGVKGVIAGLEKIGFQAKESNKQLTAMGVAMGTAVGTLGAGAIGKVAGGLGEMFKTGIKGSVELQDTMSATKAVFGDASGTIFKFADEMAGKFGTVKSEAINAAQGFGSAFKAVGYGEGEAAKLGTSLTKLAMDMASFKGTSNEEAIGALSAALRGEMDPLERYNVMLSAAAIEEEALSSGLAKTKGEIDEKAKKQATLNLIMKKSADMQGDLDRTANDTGNAWRKLTGTFTNTAVAIGESLSPAINFLVTSLGDGMKWVSDAVERNRGVITSWATWVVDSIKAIPKAWDLFVAGMAVAFIKVDEFTQNTAAVFSAMMENIGRLGKWFANNWVALIQDGVNAVGTIFQNLATNIKNLASAIWEFLKDPTKGFSFDYKPMLEGFQATADALPEMVKPKLVSMQGAIDAVGEELSRKWEVRDKAAKTKAVAEEAAEKKKGEEGPKLGKSAKKEATNPAALLLGSSEARSAVIKATRGGGIEEKQLGEQKSMNKTLKKIAKNTAKKNTDQTVSLVK